MKTKFQMGLKHRLLFPQELLKEIPEGERKRIEKEVIPFLRCIATQEQSAYERAREILSKLAITHQQGAVSEVDKMLFLLACGCSLSHLPGYATLDALHIKSIKELLGTIKQYVADTSQKRPLTFLMLASPGAGKSHFIKCIAQQLESQKIGAITYNMAGLQSSEDMIPPLDAARNMKVEDRIPLLFLDEFDSATSNVPLLLPLLWDGEVTIGPRALKLGKVIIVLAGSSPSLPTTMEQARSMRPDSQGSNDQSPKLVDLLSRINGGVFSIPPFFDAGLNIDRRTDKVCIIAQLLKQRFGNSLKEVPLSLLKFVARTDFRYGVRSIAHLVNLIPHKENPKALTVSDLEFPFDDPAALKQSSIAYHLLHHDQAFGVSKTWSEARKNDVALPVATEFLDMLPLSHFDEHFAQVMVFRMLMHLREASGTTAKPRRSRTAAPNKTVQRTGASRSAQGKVRTSSAAGSRR